MRNVHLPAEHSEADLVLAGQVAEMLESDVLFVTWSPDGYRLPEIETMVRTVDADAPPVAAVPQPSLLVEVLGTMAAFVAALFAPRQPLRPAVPAPVPRSHDVLPG